MTLSVGWKYSSNRHLFGTGEAGEAGPGEEHWCVQLQQPTAGRCA